MLGSAEPCVSTERCKPTSEGLARCERVAHANRQNHMSEPMFRILLVKTPTFPYGYYRYFYKGVEVYLG